MLGAVPGTLWLEETGGIVVRRDAAGRELLADRRGPRGAGGERGVRAGHGSARGSARMYVYQWRAGASDLFDAGLLRPDGSERASYAAFAAGVRALPKTAASPGVSWTASWSKGRLILRLKCAVAPCRGKVTVRLRSTTKTIKLVGTRSYSTKTLKLKVSAKVRAKLRKVSRRRVHLTVRSTKPVVATQRVVLKLR